MHTIQSITNYDAFANDQNYTKMAESSAQIGDFTVKKLIYRRKWTIVDSFKNLVRNLFNFIGSVVICRSKHHFGGSAGQLVSDLKSEKIIVLYTRNVAPTSHPILSTSSAMKRDMTNTNSSSLSVASSALPVVHRRDAIPLTLNQSTDAQADPSLTSVIDSASHSSAAVVTSVSSRAAPKDELKTLLDALGWTTVVSGKIYKTQDGFQFNVSTFASNLIKPNYQGFTGFFDNKILLKGATDLNTFIRVLDLLGLVNLADELKKEQVKMRELKTLYQDWAFSDNLLDTLSFASIILSHPQVFGCKEINKQDDGESAFLRFAAFSDAYAALCTYCKVNDRGVPRESFKNVFSFPESIYNQRFEGKFQAERNRFGYSFFLFSTSIPQAFEKVKNKESCINDEVPGWFRSWFPKGMHLVSTKYDERSELEKFNALGSIAKEYFVTPCRVVE